MRLNYFTYLVAIGVYAALVWFDKAPAAGLVAVLTGVISHASAAIAYERSSKAATDAANLAHPVPPPKAVTAPTTVTTA
ncbi:MAG: hypothetical protein P4L91_08025 [Burkholderiaceae bacterium]|nr:hypothetical protein [Burkholderiaceae bacterium]